MPSGNVEKEINPFSICTGPLSLLQLLQMLFEEALPLKGSDAVLSTLSLVQVRPWGSGNLGNQGHGDAAIEPETRGQPEGLGSLLLTSVGLPCWALLFSA